MSGYDDVIGMADYPSGDQPREPATAATRTLVVDFLNLTVTRRRFIIEELLGPQAWPDVVFAGQWGALLREVRERGLLDRLVELTHA